MKVASALEGLRSDLEMTKKPFLRRNGITHTQMYMLVVYTIWSETMKPDDP